MTTGIEWTDETWNVVIGCSKTSPGCDSCYAIGEAHRNNLKEGGLPDLTSKSVPRRKPYTPALTVVSETTDEIDWTGELRLVDYRMDQPLRWTEPRMIFVNSMSDLFHEDVQYDTIVEVFAVMALAQQHTFQVLTKRAKRMASIIGDVAGAATFEHQVTKRAEQLWANRGMPDWEWPGWPLPNVWPGVSIESQAYAFRARYLAETPAAVRWVSAEPLIGPLNLDHLMHELDWLVVGGESGRGPNVRPMHPLWAQTLRAQCENSGTAFFFKQWGNWSVTGPTDRSRVVDPRGGTDRFNLNAVHMTNRGTKSWPGHDLLDGQSWAEYPEPVGS